MKISRRSKAQRGGFAIIIVMVLLVLLGALVIGNSLTLRKLKQDIDQIEKRHLEQPGIRGGRLDSSTNSKPGKTAKNAVATGHLIFELCLVNDGNGSTRGRSVVASARLQ